MFFVFLTALANCGFAQSGSLRFLHAVGSEKGNYVYLYTSSPSDSAATATTHHFVVERMPYDSVSGKGVESKVQATFNAAPVASVKELNALMPPAFKEEFKTVFKLGSDEQLVAHFNQHKKNTQYSLYYSAMETKRAVGHVLVDEDARKGETVYYRVTRVDAGGQKQLWGYAVVKSKSGHPALEQLRPTVAAYNTDDSTVAVRWSMPLTGESAKRISAALNRYNTTATTVKVDDYLRGIGARLRLLNGKQAAGEKLMPTLNEKGDSVLYTYFKKCVPEEEVHAYLILEDEVGNTGGASDTALAYAVSNRTIPIIRRVAVTDTVNGIQLGWEALPKKPYITGVQVLRTGSDDKVDTVATLLPSDTAFVDYSVAVGVSYRYMVRGLYLPHLALEQKIPAQGLGSFTVFSRPLPPLNVKIAAEEKNIRLTWQGVDEPGLYGYYVYRGTSPQSLDLIAGPVKEKTFLDSAGSLSGRSQYFYSIVSQNLRQDTSDRSEIVNIIPARKIETTRPANVSLYYANGTLRIGWDDVREHDNAIAGFVLQKKKKAEATYATVGGKLLELPFAEDSLVNRGESYQYRVAAVSIGGDTTDFSDASEFMVEKPPVATVSLFYVRNVTGGIELSLPEVEYEGRKGYNVYRRPSTETVFAKVHTMDGANFEFLDKETRPGVVYVYALSVIENDGREGEKGASKSIRRTGNETN